MSLSDGQLRNKNLYTTNDAALVAYLLCRGYELLGLIDTDRTTPDGRPRLEFGITTTDPYIIDDMLPDIMKKADEYINSYYTLEKDITAHINIQEFFRNYRNCLYRLHNEESIKEKQ